jgi:hypothetical protein
MSRDIDEAFDTRIEPWAPQLPGCKGACQQGRRPCLHVEECMPDPAPMTRAGCLIILGVSAVSWALLIAFVLWAVA